MSKNFYLIFTILSPTITFHYHNYPYRSDVSLKKLIQNYYFSLNLNVSLIIFITLNERNLIFKSIENP